MRGTILYTILIALMITSLTAVDSKIDRVTVFPDRATVVRTARVNINSAGEHIIEIPGIPSSVDASTVRLKGEGTGSLKFGGVQMTRDYSPPDSGRLAEIEERLKVIADELNALNMKKQAIETERQFLANIGNIAAGSATVELRTVSVNPVAYERTFTFLDDKLMAVADRTVELAKAERKLKEERERLKREKRNLGAGIDKGYIASFPIVSKGAGTANVELSYTVWNANWSPAYDARYIPKDGVVELTYYGTVRQRSGEDWNNVAVTLSTSRPSLGAQAPELNPWYLNVFVPVYRGESRAKSGAPLAPMMAESAVMDYATAGEPWEEKEEISYIVAEAITGGGSVQFEIPGRTDIPADNSTKKLIVGTFEFDAEESYVCVPKLNEYAFLRAKFENESDFPMLAGPVSVFQGQNYVGDSKIEFVAPGEEVELSMGVNEAIKVERTLLKEFAGKGGLFGGKRRRAYAYRTEITNNSPRDISIEIYEQVPVSQDERIKLKDIEYIPELVDKPERGVFSWKVEIKKGRKTTFEVRFIIEYPKDLQIQGL